MRTVRIRMAIALAVACVALPLSAHHGKDFLIVESYELPHPHDLYAVSAEQFVFEHGNVGFHDEPSLLFGITRNVAGEVHAHIERESGATTSLAAVAPAIHIRLHDSPRIHTGITAEYEIGRNGNGDRAALSFIAGRTIGDGAIVGNVGIEHAASRSTGTYAFGYRRDMEAERSWGVEARGAFAHDEEQELLLAGYAQIAPRLTLKGGVGAALGAGKPQAMIRTGIVFRF